MTEFSQMTTSKISRGKPAANQKRSTSKSGASMKRAVGGPKAAPGEGKIAAIVSLMRRPDGASVTELMQQTGWQAHSVRGAISGSVKRKLGLRVLSQKVGKVRIYRIREAV